MEMNFPHGAMSTQPDLSEENRGSVLEAARTRKTAFIAVAMNTPTRCPKRRPKPAS
jgi:hypothetical protein